MGWIVTRRSTTFQLKPSSNSHSKEVKNADFSKLSKLHIRARRHGFVPDGTDVQRLVPGWKKVVPDGTDMVPDDVQVVSDGTDMVPDGTTL